MFYYTYVLYSLKSKTFYIGFSKYLKQRVIDYNNGLGGAYSIRNLPFKLVFYKAYLSEGDARKQEQFYKTGYGRELLNEKIDTSLTIINNS